jgi:hypothetical protein
MDNKNIQYIVKIQDKYAFELHLTTIRTTFCGKLVNNSFNHFFFELNGSNALVVVPISWIEYMAPSKRHWELDNINEVINND